MEEGTTVSEEERQAFVRKSYFLASVFVIATSIKTCLTMTIDAFHDAVLNNLYLAYLGLVVFFVCSLVLYIVPLKTPCNIIIAALMVESLSAAVVTVSALCTQTAVLAAYTTAITAAILVSLFSVFIACDITKFVDILTFGVLINFLFCIIMVIMIAIYKQKIITLILIIWQLITFLIYHTQIICGNKFAIIERYGTNGASVIIYIDVVIAYVLILVLYKPSLWINQLS